MLLPGVVFGNKHEEVTDVQVIVGDNSYFGLDVKVFGPVTIWANAVVTKDIPDDSTAVGIPAKKTK